MAEPVHIPQNPQGDYWRIQQPRKPLFDDILWSKPEQRARAGKLGIIGGNKLGFSGVAGAYQIAHQAGVGELRVLLPDALKKTIPPTISEAIFAASNQSGSLSAKAADELNAIAGWADGLLLIGDAGRSSETAILYEQLLQKYAGQLVITRDAIDLIKNNPKEIVERPNTLLVASFAQLQKLFQSVYYPKVLTFSMQLTNLVDALHKFTISYPVSVAVLHREQMVIASDGQVVSTPWDLPMHIWRGDVAAAAAVFWLWNPSRTLEAVATSLVQT